VLDLISAIAIFIKKGYPLLTILFVIGSGYISFYLYRNNKRTWNPIDNFIVFLIFICCIVWYRSGEIMAIIASTTAVLLAGIPQLISVAKNPNKSLLPIFYSFTIGNLFFFFVSLYSGKELFEFEEFVKFYIVPVANGLMSLVYVLLSFRKKNTKPAYPYNFM
jgi:hypothetical protein